MQYYATAVDQVNKGSSSSSTDSLTGLLTSDALVAVAGYLVSSQQKPSQQWLAVFESTLQSMLTSSVDLSLLTLTGEQMAQGLAAMQAWGCKPGSGFRSAAVDRSRVLLAATTMQGLGPMLLGLCSIGAKPPQAWLLDWCAVVRQQIEEEQQLQPQGDVAAVADNNSSSSSGMGTLSTIAAALAAAGHKPSQSSSSGTWWDCYCQAVLPLLPTASISDLSTLLQSLQQLTGGSDGFKPGVPGWMEGVGTRVEEMKRGGVGASAREVQLLELYWEALKTKTGFSRR